MSTKYGMIPCYQCRKPVCEAKPGALLATMVGEHLFCDECFAGARDSLNSGQFFTRGAEFQQPAPDEDAIAAIRGGDVRPAFAITILKELKALRQDVSTLLAKDKDNSDTTPEDAERYANKLARMLLGRRYPKAQKFLQNVYDQVEELGMITRKQMRAVDRIEGNKAKPAMRESIDSMVDDDNPDWDEPDWRD